MALPVRAVFLGGDVASRRGLGNEVTAKMRNRANRQDAKDAKIEWIKGTTLFADQKLEYGSALEKWALPRLIMSNVW